MISDHATPEKAPGATDPRAFGLTKAAYSVNEALEILSVGRTSFYRLATSGALPLAKLGKKTLVLSSDIAAFLTQLRDAA
jgi:excisionase family DNA binding protein